VPFVRLEVLGSSGFVGFFLFFFGWFGGSYVLKAALRFVLIKVLLLIKKRNLTFKQIGSSLVLLHGIRRDSFLSFQEISIKKKKKKKKKKKNKKRNLKIKKFVELNSKETKSIFME
jgi:hypothetical protein